MRDSRARTAPATPPASAVGTLPRNKTSLLRPATPVNVPPRLSNLGRMNTLASWAQQLAWALLQEPLPRRWAHVQGVSAGARNLAPVLGADADLLEAAARLLRHHRSRRTRTRRRPEFRIRPCTGRTGQRADLLRHDHQPGRPARAGRKAAPRDT